MHTVNKITLSVLAIALFIGLGLLAYNSNKPLGDIRMHLQHATYLYDQQASISEFTLIDHNNNVFTPNSIRGRWTFWFFGFTHCPDICPITLGILSTAVNNLKSKHHISEDISIIFVSVDPKRDQAEKLKVYVNAFSKDAIGVTAPQQTLAPFLKNMGIIATKQKAGNTESNYLVDHSSSVYLIAPDTGISALFGAPHTVEHIMQDFLTIQKYYR